MPTLEVITESNSEEEAKGNYKFIFIYKYDNLSEISDLSENDFRVNADLGYSLHSITYSTARGVLLTNLKQSVFKDFILPIIKPILPDL